MKTFKQYMAESSDIRSRMRPAVMHDGKVHKAKNPAESHQEIVDRKGLDPKKSTRGFWLRDHGAETGKFLSPEEAAQHLGRGRTTADSTDLKDASDRMTFMGKDHDPFAGSYASPDQIKSNVLAMRKFGTTLSEGNPLSRMHKHEKEGRHFIAISTERPGLTKKEISQRNKRLVSMAREAGFGVRKAEGRYEGNKETSHIIHAKEAGREAGSELVAFGRKAGQQFDQDSVLHHNGKTARLIGTNETGYPGKDKSEKVGGKLKYNKKSPFQTELKPSKKRSPATFTTE